MSQITQTATDRRMSPFGSMAAFAAGRRHEERDEGRGRGAGEDRQGVTSPPPRRSRSATFARPGSSRSLRAPAWASSHAIASGVRPRPSRALTSAPASRRRAATASPPPSAARCRGVRPSLSVASTSAPREEQLDHGLTAREGPPVERRPPLARARHEIRALIEQPGAPLRVAVERRLMQRRVVDLVATLRVAVVVEDASEEFHDLAPGETEPSRVDSRDASSYSTRAALIGPRPRARPRRGTEGGDRRGHSSFPRRPAQEQ